MKRRKKLIIAILLVCIIGVGAFIYGLLFAGPSLNLGDKNILVLASDKDEQLVGELTWHIWLN